MWEGGSRCEWSTIIPSVDHCIFYTSLGTKVLLFLTLEDSFDWHLPALAATFNSSRSLLLQCCLIVILLLVYTNKWNAFCCPPPPNMHKCASAHPPTYEERDTTELHQDAICWWKDGILAQSKNKLHNTLETSHGCLDRLTDHILEAGSLNSGLRQVSCFYWLYIKQILWYVWSDSPTWCITDKTFFCFSCIMIFSLLSDCCNSETSNHASNTARSSKISGSKKLSNDHSSDRLFWSGVPVNSSRFPVRYSFSVLHKWKSQPSFNVAKTEKNLTIRDNIITQKAYSKTL